MLADMSAADLCRRTPTVQVIDAGTSPTLTLQMVPQTFEIMSQISAQQCVMPSVHTDH